MTAALFSRRAALQAGAGGLAALWLPVIAEAAARPAVAGAPTPTAPPPAATPAFTPAAWIRITADDQVTLVLHRSEMGQGIRTALATILCDELDADLARVQLARADGDARYGDQATVGDESIVSQWTPLRTAAARARAMLVAAAAEQLQVPAARLRTEAGRVHVVDAQPPRSLPYGTLVARAAQQVVPDAPPLKARADFRYIGRPRGGVDLLAQTTGRMVYGLDVRCPGGLHAVIARAPLPGATLAAFDATAARRVPGVVNVFAVEAAWAAEGRTAAGVVVVARDSWACLQARRALDVQWNLAGAGAMDDAELRRRFEAAADAPGAVYRSGGDLPAARARAATTLTRRYWTPFLAHATLEPPNCTADVRAGSCEVWAPTQSPGDARERIAAELKLPIDRVTVHVTDIGGGYGRKSLHDFVLEAVRASRRVKAPVKLFWTREDDLRHGFFRSPSLQVLEAGLDAAGEVVFWRHHAVQSSQRATSEDDGPVTELAPYEMVASTASRLPYDVGAIEVTGTHVETPLKRSWMRGVQDSYLAFATNCFLDELAQRAGRDPVAMRLALLGPPRRLQFLRSATSPAYWTDTGRLATVIRRAAELSAAGAAPPAGTGHGLAAHVQSATSVAVVAEVQPKGATPADGFTLARLTCVVDCGIVVNPDGARAQVEGALLYALGSVLYGRIVLSAEAGVVTSNFHDYPVARMGDVPARIDVEFIDSGAEPTGLGEPCAPLLAPALANALARAGAPRPTDWPFGLGGTAA